MNTKQFVKTALAVLLIISAACKKQNDPGESIPVGNRISRIENDNDHAAIAYDANGNIASITRKQSNGAIMANYVFTYENGKVKEVDFGGRWRYSYTGKLLTQVETLNSSGLARYKRTFTYSGNQVSVQTEFIIREGRGTQPYVQTRYTYHGDGNISKKEIFEYVNDAWKKSEEIYIPEYDSNLNAGQPLECYPYLPANLFCVNNPLREIYASDTGVEIETVIHVYAYDAVRRPVARKTTHRFTGFPGVVENKMIYY